MKHPGLVACLAALVACASSTASPPPPPPPPPTGVDGGGAVDAEADAAPGEPIVTLVSVFDLPRTAATQGLSGATYDAATRALLTIQDLRPSIVPLHPSEDWKIWTVGPALTVTGVAAEPWDGEGLVWTGDGFEAVANETAPTVVRLDASGRVVSALTLPEHFAKQSPGNKGLESLSRSPSGRFLFTANEGALVGDGTLSTKSKGTTVRLFRRELGTSTDREIAYRTEPLGAGIGGDMGVSDLAALSDDELLVLERGFQTGYGNTVRIFKVGFAGPEVIDTASLGTSAPVVTKALLVDLAALPSEGFTHPGPQPNPILDNYEALAVGPLLPDGRRLLFVVSDDNASDEQLARILVLAVRGL